MALPREIIANEKPVKNVLIRQGINREALEELEERPTIEDLADKEHAPWTRFIGKSTLITEGSNATMKIGEIFRSEIILT